MNNSNNNNHNHNNLIIPILIGNLIGIGNILKMAPAIQRGTANYSGNRLGNFSFIFSFGFLWETARFCLL